MPSDEDVFPVVSYGEGAISGDGRAVLCRLLTASAPQTQRLVQP
jgi:hypothetical protein